MVSESGCENFRTVKCNGSVNTVVKWSCPGFKSLGICSHAVAVSEKQGVLTKYLDAFNRSSSLNITSINVAGKQDPKVGRKKSNPRKRFKGPMPNVETVVSCKNVFGLTTPKQPQLNMQQHDIHNVQYPTSKVCGVNNQTPADSQNDTLYGGTHVQSEALVPLAQSECDASRCLQLGSNSFDSAFSFLADLLNDDPTSVSLAGMQDCTLPSNVSASSSLVRPVTADSIMTTTWGSKTATPIPNVHITGSWGSKSITSPPNVSMTASWGSKSATPSPNVPMTASRGPKPAMPPTNEPYQVGTIWGNVRKCFGCKREFLPAVPPDDQYVPVRQESDWYWEKHSMKWRLGRKSNRYYHMLPQCILINFPSVVSPLISIPPDIPVPSKLCCSIGFSYIFKASLNSYVCGIYTFAHQHVRTAEITNVFMFS